MILDQVIELFSWYFGLDNKRRFNPREDEERLFLIFYNLVYFFQGGRAELIGEVGIKSLSLLEVGIECILDGVQLFLEEFEI